MVTVQLRNNLTENAFVNAFHLRSNLRSTFIGMHQGTRSSNARNKIEHHRNGRQMERVMDALGTQMERERSSRLFPSSTVYCFLTGQSISRASPQNVIFNQLPWRQGNRSTLQHLLTGQH